MTTLAERHGRDLLRTAYLLCGDAHLAQDLTQTALLRATRRWRRQDLPESPHAYLRRIVLNEFLSWRRRRWWGEHPTADVGLDRSDTDDVSGIDDRDEAWRLLATLPRQQRAAIVLRLYEDLTDEDIGVAMGCSASTVRSHVSRGLATLRTRLSTTEEAL